MRRSISLALAALLVLPAAPPAHAQAGAVGMIGALAAVDQALKGIHESISQLDQAAKDRLAQVDVLIAKTIHDIDDVLEKTEKKLIKDTDSLVTSTFNEANDTLYLATSGLSEQEAAFSQDLNNSIVNAAKTLSGIPFAKVPPFLAMAYPTVVVPTATGRDFKVSVVGYFRTDWGKPVVELTNPRSTLANELDAQNRLVITIPHGVVSANPGRTLRLSVAYPVSKALFRSAKYDTRAVFVRVLPAIAATYKVLESKAVPDVAYDTITRTFDENTEAGAGESTPREIPRSLNSISGPVDTTVYDLGKSRITNASLSSGGNNPANSNSSSVTVDATGQSVVLKETAVGSKSHYVNKQCDAELFHKKVGSYECGYWANAEGANRSDRVTVTIELARRQQAVDWPLSGGAMSGSLRWGDSVSLLANGGRELSSLRVEIRDFTFDPPQTAIVTKTYRSASLTVGVTGAGVNMSVRSFRAMAAAAPRYTGEIEADAARLHMIQGRIPKSGDAWPRVALIATPEM